MIGCSNNLVDISGEANTSHVASPNTVYKELDKSVDWHEVMQQKHLKQEGLVKGLWASLHSPLCGNLTHHLTKILISFGCTENQS